jgi:RimJ/RimL family protein N-acetyltransferase
MVLVQGLSMNINIKKLYQKIREKGIKHYLKIILKKLLIIMVPGYKKLFVFEILLSEYKSIGGMDNIVLKVVRDIDEIMPFIRKREEWYLNHSRDLLMKGNLCFVGEVDNQVACCVWTSYNEVYLSEIKYRLKVDKNIVPLIDGYTLPQYRGLGIYKAVWDYCIKYFQAQPGYEKIYGFIASSNKRSLKVHKKLRLENIVIIITYLRILGIKFYFIKKRLKIKSKKVSSKQVVKMVL